MSKHFTTSIMERTIALRWATQIGGALALRRAIAGDFTAPVIAPWLRRRVRSTFGDIAPAGDTYTLFALGARCTLFRETPDYVLQTCSTPDLESGTGSELAVALYTSMISAIGAYADQHTDQWHKFTEQRRTSRAVTGEMTTEAIAEKVAGRHVLYLPAAEIEATRCDTTAIARRSEVDYMTDQHGADMTLGALHRAFRAYGDMAGNSPDAMRLAMHSIHGKLNRQKLPAINRAVYTMQAMADCVKSIRNPATRDAVISCLNIVCIYPNK